MNFIIVLIIGIGAEFVVKTLFLLAGLWFMIKVQKLDYNFLGLLGTAALGSLLDTVISKFFGIGLTAVLVIPALMFCLTKLTRSDHTDVVFTMGVAYVFAVGMNWWLIAMLVGDVRVTAKAARQAALANATNTVASPKETAAANERAKQEAAQKELQELTGKLTLKGITKGATPLALVQSGTKSHTLSVGESFTMLTGRTNGPTTATVTVKEIADHDVTLDVDGEKVTLALRFGQ